MEQGRGGVPETCGGAAVPEIVKTRGVAAAPAGNKRTPVKPDLTEGTSRGEKQRFVKNGSELCSTAKKVSQNLGSFLGPWSEAKHCVAFQRRRKAGPYYGLIFRPIFWKDFLI